MKIKKYSTIDLYYNEEELGSALKKRKQLIKQGYELNMEDSGNPFDYCDQFIKYFKPKTK